MAQILGPGESMNVNEVRTDETLRFHALLQADGNLVVYAHRIAPIRRIAIGASDTANLGANVRLHLNPGGWLEILDATTGARKWFRPVRVPPHPGLPQPSGVPNSTLHLQADGRLVIYRPGGFSPNNVSWAIGGVDQPTEDVCVIPGSVTVDVSDGGTIAPPFNKRVMNNSPETVGVRDGHTFVALPPGDKVDVAAPTGTIAVSGQIYYFPLPGAPGEDNAISIPGNNTIYGPEQDEIKVIEGDEGLALA